MPIDSKFYKEKKGKSFYSAFIFLAFVIVLTGGLYVYNMNLVSANEDTQTGITRLESSIDKLKADENIKAYSVYTANKQIFDQLSERSQVPKFITSVKKTLQNKSLNIDNLSYSNGVVSVRVEAASDDRKAYAKLVKFLQDYRADESAIFDLGLVESVTGQEDLKFAIDFTLK